MIKYVLYFELYTKRTIKEFYSKRMADKECKYQQQLNLGQEGKYYVERVHSSCR